MMWTVLVDNRSNDPASEMTEQRVRSQSCLSHSEPCGDCGEVETEHGLSILLETDRHRFLLDTGASDIFIRNAKRMGIDLSSVDYVFISHGHSDHAGGLRYFLELNQRAKVIVSSAALSGQFFSKRAHLHSITAVWPFIPEERLLVVDETCEIADGVHVIAHIPQVHPKPKGNQNLFVETDDGRLVPDDFCHELALYADGLLFTGCAHSGLENILAACPWPVRCVLGGFHLLDGYESDEELTALARRLKDKYPNTHFHTSHCTGNHAFEVLKHLMEDHLHSFNCGCRKELSDLPL